MDKIFSIKNNIICLLIILLISVFFFQDFLLYGELPITSSDPAIKFWHNTKNAKHIQSGNIPLWDNTSGVGRSVFASDIFSSAFSAVPLFISLFDDHITGHVFYLWLEVILFGVLITYYLRRWCQLNLTTALISFTIFMFCPAFLNEYFYNSFGGYLLIPLMLEQIDKYLQRRTLITAVWLGCLLALMHWLSNISVPQYSVMFISIYMLYSVWDRKSITKSIIETVRLMMMAGFVWIGLMAFNIAPMLGEVLNSYRSHISSVSGGSSIQDIILSFLFPFTSGMFIDGMMIPTGLLTRFESLGGYIHILVLPSIFVFLANRLIFSRRERFFFYYLIGFIFLDWLNNYVPLLGYFQKITKGTGWWRSYPLCIMMGAFCIGIVVSKIKRHEIDWDKGVVNKGLKTFLMVLSSGYGLAFASFILLLTINYIKPDLLSTFLSSFTVRPISHILSYLEHYYFVWPRVLYIALIPATLAVATMLFIKQTKDHSHRQYSNRLIVILFFVILIGQYSLTQIYYPFNNGIRKAQELKESEIFSNIGADGRIAIVFNTLNDIENNVRQEIGYTDKDASLELSLAMQAYPEVTRFQSNNTMYGAYISSLGPAVYTKGSNFTPQRLAIYNDRLLKQEEYLRQKFKRTMGYIYIGRDSIGSKLLDVAGINYIISSLTLLNEKLKLIAHGNNYHVYHNRNAVPKVYFARNITTVMKEEEIINALESDHFTPGSDVIVEEQQDISPSKDASGNISVLDYSRGIIKLLVEKSEPSLLVINESYHPGWKAYIDSQEVKLVRANVLFMGLPLRAGKHDIELNFRAPAFRIGVLISCLTIGLILFVTVANMWRYNKMNLFKKGNLVKESNSTAAKMVNDTKLRSK